jgi:hypothetical protein
MEKSIFENIILDGNAELIAAYQPHKPSESLAHFTLWWVLLCRPMA